MNKHKGQSGFTLLELMVTVAVIGIISMFAIPSYMESVRKSKIAQITQDMVSLAGDVEAIRMQGNAYNSTKVSDHVTEKKDVKYSKNIIGVIAISGATKLAYTLTATAQDFDAGDCGTMTINNLGVRTPAACWKQ